MSSDRRKIIRRQVRYPARIDLGDGGDFLTCLLVDASDEGVQIVIAEAIAWPREIDLVLGYGSSGRRRCRVAWSRGQHAGLEFLAKNTPLDLPPDADALLPRLEQAARAAQAAASPADDPQPTTFDIDTLRSR